MSRIVRTEIRKRGFFGKLFKFLFILFNILMLIWMLSYWIHVSDLYKISSDTNIHTGLTIGVTFATGFILAIWAFGAVILGLLTLLSRGKTIIIEETQERGEPRYERREPRF